MKSMMRYLKQYIGWEEKPDIKHVAYEVHLQEVDIRTGVVGEPVVGLEDALFSADISKIESGMLRVVYDLTKTPGIDQIVQRLNLNTKLVVTYVGRNTSGRVAYKKILEEARVMSIVYLISKEKMPPNSVTILFMGGVTKHINVD